MLTKFTQGATLYTVLATVFIVVVSYFWVNRKKKVAKPLDIHLLNKRILEYKPEPMIDHNLVEALRNKVIDTHIPDESNPNCFNLAKVNYLDFLNNDYIKKKAEECIRTYGVGSCGPRGFYGTIDVHLDLESKIADFMGMEETVLYSYGFSTISSAVGAYCKKSDIVFCDEHISFASQQGLLAAKSTIVYFKHNDMADLEEKLKEYEVKEKKRNKLYRKFLIVEGINGKTGKLCPLPELMLLRKKYFLRIFLDESLSFGVLGKFGRGITEHFNIDRNDVDMIMGSLEGSFSSIGGFCVGASVVIEHQRLSGLGYCFSASLPPFLSYITTCAIELFEKEPEMFEKLSKVSISMHEKLKKLQEKPNVQILSDDISPKKILKINNIDAVHKFCVEKDVYMAKEDDTLVMNLNINYADDQLDKIVNVLMEACESLN
ncbi:serine palmitoyltransferase 1 [Onthophagus taurus]|uniref:serine palmitoyltransferase 1 n=1 Tax=Onthophagus taurus TaxID=166361 RepID=UPI000C203013|nr:serine palmitoyltransferase 1 [Onthophagus taurus]